MRLAELRAEANVTSGALGRMSAVATVNGGCGGVFEPGVFEGWTCYGTSPFITVELDAALIEEIFPSDRMQSVQPFRWTIDGTVIPPEQILSSYYEENLDGSIVWGITLARKSDRINEFLEPLGSPKSQKGPPGGKGAVDLDIVYLTSSGPKAVRVMTNGMIQNSRGEISGTETRQLNGVGPAGRWQNRLGSLDYPVGHGQLRGVVAGELFKASGVPEASVFLSGGSEMMKEVLLSNANGMSLAQQILGAEIKAAIFDEAGDAVLRSITFDPDQRVEFVFTAEDILTDPGLPDSPAVDGPTRVTISWETPEVLEDCGLVSETLTTTALREFAPVGIDGTIDTACVLGGSPYAPPSALRTEQRVEVTTTKRCGTVMATETKTYAYRNIQRAKTKTDGTCHSVNVETGTGNGVIYQSERLMLVKREVVSRFFDERNFLTKEVAETYEWHTIEQARYTRTDPTASWTEVSAGSTKSLYNDGHWAPSTPVEIFGLTERSTKETTVTEDGFVTAERETIQRYTIDPVGTAAGGVVYLYNDGSIGQNPSETFQTDEVITTTYAELGPETILKLTTRRTPTGQLEIDKEELEGYFPAAEIADDAIKLDEMYDDLPDPDRQVDASNFDSESFELTVHSAELEEHRERWDLQTSHSWIETEGEAEAYGWHLIREGSAIDVDFAVPVNALLRAGQRHDLSLSERGIDYDRFRLTRVRHTEDAARSWTEVSGSYYPEDVTP